MKPQLMQPGHCYIGRDFALAHTIVKPDSVKNVTVPASGHTRTDITSRPVFREALNYIDTYLNTWFWDEQEVDELTPEEYQQFIDAWDNFRNSFRDLAAKFDRRHPVNRGDVNKHNLPPSLRTNINNPNNNEHEENKPG